MAQLLSETEGYLVDSWRDRVVGIFSSHQYCLCAVKSDPSAGKSVCYMQLI